MPALALDGDQSAAGAVTDATAKEIADMRGRLASIRGAASQPAVPAPPAPAVQVPLAIPQADGQILLRLLAGPDGVTAKAAGDALGKSKSRAADYLRILESRGIAARTGISRASRYRLARQSRPEPARARPAGYVTIEALAAAVHDGLVDVDDDTRAVMERAREIRDRGARRSHLTVVPDPESDAS